jgi:creatinine amidohydrolase
MATFLWELNINEFKQLVEKNALVILPVGAVEGHGPHLPLGTDIIQPMALAVKLSERFEAMIAPPIHYGECSSTRNLPGTISLSFDTLRALLQELLDELYRQGIRHILVLSGHAARAHMMAQREAGKIVLKKHPDLKLMIVSDYEIAYDLLGKDFDADDGHAGNIETSRIMKHRMDLVGERPPKASLERPNYMITENPEDRFPSGYWGDPTKASKENADKVEEYIFEELVRLIEENLLG